MSLSTQLTRGTLALPMLALFGVLALVAGQSVEAQGYVPQELGVPAAEAEATAEPRELVLADGQRLELEARSGDAACGAHARPQLLLASAPGDLGPIAKGTGCRA
jgi:ferric-dicitrate binding protein FerR (iron transport regulator)